VNHFWGRGGGCDYEGSGDWPSFGDLDLSSLLTQLLQRESLRRSIILMEGWPDMKQMFELEIEDLACAILTSYNCYKGPFVGVSLEGNIVVTRMDTNLRFYGDPYLTTSDILLGTVERPKALSPSMLPSTTSTPKYMVRR
ncbi:hypothetical protein Dimus_017803, partial [Dionaea muscipula]